MAYNEYDKKTLDKLHNVELELLNEFVRICDKNKLTYFLVGGSLLGAVRHSGFIPWDDDIDVGMPRKDYDKFLKIVTKELKDDYFIRSVETNKDYYLPFAKIMKKNTLFVEEAKNNDNPETYGDKGIFIDIFPFENVKKFGLGYKTRFALSYAIMDTIFYKLGSCELKDTKYKPLTILFSIFSKRRLTKIFHHIVTKCKDDNSKYISVIGAGYGFRKEFMERSNVLPVKKITFENKKYNGMNNNDAYLSSLYGDYMKLPPKEKRINHKPMRLSFDAKADEYYVHEDLVHLQQVLVEMLDEFVRVCKKNKLEYFLVGGTCLGAVRHKGFIPWDDDIDVAMPREDYEKFLEVAKTDLKKEYFLDYYKTDDENHFGFAKIKKNNTTFLSRYCYKVHNGFFLDIFPIDYCDNKDSLKTKISASLSRCILETMKYRDHNITKIKSLRRPYISIPYLIFSNRTLHKKVDKLYTCQNNGTRKNCTIYSGVYYYKRDIYPKSVVFPYSIVEFEGRKYHAFHDTDAYLTGLYDNYMELPPIEKRFAHAPRKIDFNEGDVRNSVEEYNKLNRK